MNTLNKSKGYIEKPLILAGIALVSLGLYTSPIIKTNDIPVVAIYSQVCNQHEQRIQLLLDLKEIKVDLKETRIRMEDFIEGKNI